MHAKPRRRSLDDKAEERVAFARATGFQCHRQGGGWKDIGGDL